MKLPLMALYLALVPAAAFAAPVLKSGPSLFNSAILEQATCLWGGDRFSVGASFCAGVGRSEHCVLPDELHSNRAWWLDVASSSCKESKYPNATAIK